MRKKKHIWIWILSLFAVLCYLPSLTGQGKDKELRLVGYLPDYRSTAAYNRMDYSRLTHLNIAFCNPDQEGNLTHGFSSDAVLTGIINQAHSQGVKVLAVIGSDKGYTYLANLTSMGNYEAYNKKIMAFIRKYNFDGVDLDIERGAPAAFWGNYEAWAKDLRSRLSAENKLLSAAVATSFSHKITDKTFTYFDYINVMAYDDDSLEGHSSFEFAYNMLKHFEEKRGIPKNKLVLGVPCYGRSKDHADSYQSILSQYPEACYYDSMAGYSYNGLTTIQHKAVIAKDYGGMMLWELTQDASGEQSILTTIYDTLNLNLSSRTVLLGTAKTIKSTETYENTGILIIDGVLKNSGSLVNKGLMIINGQLENEGTVTNNGRLINHGSIVNGVITGTKTILGTKAVIKNISVAPYTGSYDNKRHNAATVRGLLKGDTVYYRVNQNTYSRTMPQVKEVQDSCRVTVKVVRNENFAPWESKAVAASVKKVTVKKVGTIRLKRNSARKITISFQPVSKASGYELYRSSKKAGAYKRIKVLGSKAKKTFTDSKLSPGTTYYYKVRAYRAVNGKKLYGSYSKLNKATTSLEAVKLKKPVIKKLKTGNVRLKWSKTKNAQGYQIYRSTNKKKAYQKIATVKSAAGLSYVDKKLKGAKKYYYKIRAYKKVSGKMVYGNFSQIRQLILK